MYYVQCANRRSGVSDCVCVYIYINILRVHQKLVTSVQKYHPKVSSINGDTINGTAIVTEEEEVVAAVTLVVLVVGDLL